MEHSEGRYEHCRLPPGTSPARWSSTATMKKQRLYVTPGLSCYWQIAPHRNDLSFEEWMDLDVEVCQGAQLLGWIGKLIFKTFKVCLLGRGE